jgi:hypothetical protein
MAVRMRRCIPAEVWRRNFEVGAAVCLTSTKSAELDLLWETADTSRANNYFPRRIDTPVQLSPPPPEQENRMRASRRRGEPGFDRRDAPRVRRPHRERAHGGEHSWSWRPPSHWRCRTGFGSQGHAGLTVVEIDPPGASPSFIAFGA